MTFHDPNDLSGIGSLGTDVAAWANVMEGMTVEVIHQRLAAAGIGLGASVEIPGGSKRPHRGFVETYLASREANARIEAAKQMETDRQAEEARHKESLAVSKDAICKAKAANWWAFLAVVLAAASLGVSIYSALHY